MPFDPPPHLTNADEYRHPKPRGAEDLHAHALQGLARIGRVEPVLVQVVAGDTADEVLYFGRRNR